MDWTATTERASKVIDVAIKAELHSFVLIFVGAYISLHGQKDIGMPLITAGCLAFKGNR